MFSWSSFCLVSGLSAVKPLWSHDHTHPRHEQRQRFVEIRDLTEHVLTCMWHVKDPNASDPWERQNFTLVCVGILTPQKMWTEASSPWVVDSLRWYPYRDALTEISQTSLFVKCYTTNRFLVQLYSINLPPQFRSIKYTC